MSEVFISYRRGDGGWAGRLADRLRDPFPVFFDRRSIEGGAEFPTEITEALVQTRIFLAVIGKRWLEKENLERLGNEQDWVGREILAALRRRPEIRVVPILMEGVTMPGAQLLPPAFADFVTRNAIALDDDSWDSDVDALIADIGSWLSGSGQTRAATTPMPPDLPFLCDRVEQEDDLTPLAQGANRGTHAFACILHGHKWEAHDGFLSRLRQQRVLEDLFDATDTGVDVYPLEWNRAHAQSGAYAELLRRAIKGGAMQRRSAADEELAKFLRRPGRPTLLVIQVTWADLQAYGAGLLTGLEQAWKDLIASLGDAPAETVVLWVNVSYEDAAQDVPPSASLPRLTRLGPITEAHIREWMRRKEVERFVKGYETDLLQLANDPRYCIAPGQIHMQRFVDAVRGLVKP